jgi:hypothetical protein
VGNAVDDADYGSRLGPWSLAKANASPDRRIFARPQFAGEDVILA